MKKICIIPFLFFIIFGEASSQDYTRLDSIEQSLNLAKTTEDSIIALCLLAWEISKADPDKTEKYGKKALALADQTSDPRLRSEAYDAGALAFWLAKEEDKAIQLYEKSLAIGIEHQLDDRIAWCNYNLAQLAMQNNDREAAIKYIKASQVAFEDAGMDRWVINSYWMNLKMLTGDDRRIALEEIVQKLESIISKTTDDNELLFYYLDIARIYSQQEKHSKSLEYVLKGLEIAETSNSKKGLMSAYSSIGDYLRDIQHNHKVALKYYQRTLEMYEKNNVNWGIAYALFEIGKVYKEMPDDSMAFVYFSKAIEKARQMNSNYYLSNIDNAIGEIHFRNADYLKAKDLFMRSYTLSLEYSNPDIQHAIIINLGLVYWKLNDKKTAYDYFNKSYQLADSIDDSHLRATSLIHLGDWQMAQNNPEEAEKFYVSAYYNAISMNALSLQIESVSKLEEVYTKLGRFENAYSYSNRLRLLEDSLRKSKETHNLARLESLFELENIRMQRELDRAVADAKIERHVLIRNFFIGGFILMTLVGLYLFLSFRRKKKQNIVLAEQKEKIEKMSNKIHEVDEMKLQFFTNISHELRTPLTLITGLSEQLVQTDFDRKHMQDKLNTIYKNASKLHTLVNQILDIRKLDNGGSTIRLVKDDLVKYIANLVSNFTDFAKRKNIELVFVSDKSKLIVHYDFDKLDKILSNLLSNSIKFCSENDSVRVTLYTREGSPTQCIIEVNDTGKGIPADQLKFIFQPFYQATNTQGGSGLGLALVRELVRVLNGHIDVESKMNKGTRITLRLPFEKIEEEAVSTSIDDADIPMDTTVELTDSSNQIERTKLAGSSDDRTLLIVEDNSDLQEFISDILKDEFTIFNALNGEAGLELANKYIPDVIISDIMMPGMDGIQLCEKLKSHPCTSHIPILMLTAKTDQESMLRSFKTGADDYVVKPFSAVILKSRVQNLVAQRIRLIQKFSQQFKVEPTQIVLPDTDKAFLEKLINVIEKNIAEPTLDIDFLASEMHVSRTQLYRKLKALTDLSGNQFIRTIRLKRAAQLLSKNQLSIAEVMQETGFSNYSHFNSCFREQFSRSPKEFAGEIN